ncbi:hypothetical protein [Kitasatospora sp. NPDC088346]|uniref:hypothetical protein n=1 Tax=Kitasatospora sp. NPDC088346 TaxID=3364073 RepID=UPI0038264D82
MTRTRPTPSTRPARLLRAAAWLLATVCCALGALQYGRASTDGSLAAARDRDTALAAGRQAVAELTSAEAGRAEATRARWLAVSGGALHDRLGAGPATDPGVTSHGTVVEAAVTALDPGARTARLIAVVRVELIPAAGTVTTDRRRLAATLTRTGAGWKVTALAAVPVGTA